MSNQILFAVEVVETSQGWFTPGQLLPKAEFADREEELKELFDKQKIGVCAYDSPLAKRVHEARQLGSRTLIGECIAAGISAESPEPEPEQPTVEGLEGARADLLSREQAVAERETDIVARAADLQKAVDDLTEQKSALDKRAFELDKRQAELDAREAALLKASQEGPETKGSVLEAPPPQTPST